MPFRGAGSEPDTIYTRTWTAGRGQVRFLERADGSRLRYFVAGDGPPLVLLHTVRTQLDYFEQVIPLLWDSHTVIAPDLPGMGWSDIVQGANYHEPDLRAAVVELLSSLGLSGVVLAGESIGGTLALSASLDLPRAVERVVAFNPYDYPGGIKNGGQLNRVVISGIEAAGVGPIFASLENTPLLKALLSSGLAREDVPPGILRELRRVAKRPLYSSVSRAVFKNLDSLIAARRRYPDVRVPVTLAYGEHDWSRQPDRDEVARLLPEARRVLLAGTGHFTAWDDPATMARVLRQG